MGNISEKCEGCSKIDNNGNCMVYADPVSQMRWVDGESKLGCGFNAKKYTTDKTPKQKVRVGQQKQKKK